MVSFNNEMSSLSEASSTAVKKFVNQFSESGTISNGITEASKGEFAQTASLYDGRMLAINESLDIVYDSYSMEAGKTIISESVVKALKGASTTEKNRRGRYIEYVMPVKSNVDSKVIGVILLRVSTEDCYSQYFKTQSLLFSLAVIICILFIVAITIVTSVATKSLRQLSKSVADVALGDTEAVLPVRGYRELRELTEAFNAMLLRMSELEDSRKRFVSDVSHELKTPMTSMKLLSESLLSQETAPEEMYREFLTDIDSELERENKIINSLLELVNEEQRHEQLSIAKTNINELLESIVKQLSPIAEKSQIKLIFDSYRITEAEVDEIKLYLAFRNLVENAIKYNRENGWVRVSLNSDHKYFLVTVADSGIGIPEAAKDKIFERFYRVDKARSRATGGTGLGLSITKNLIIMHHGTIKVTSIVGEGSTFTVRIPLVYNGSSVQNGGNQ